MSTTTTNPKDRTREILKKVRQIELRTNRLVNDSLAGEYHSVFKGRGMDFDEVRQYYPGDEVRMIDWNVTARSGTPFVKKFTEERELTIILMVDVSASGNFGSTTQSKRELAAEVASVLAFSAIRNRDKVGLVLFSDQIEQFVPPKKGRQHVLRVVREILAFEPQHKGTDLVQAMDFVNLVVKRRAIVFMLSDFRVPDTYQRSSNSGGVRTGLDAIQPGLRLTNKRHDLVALNIADPHEADLPNVGWLALEDAESGEVFEVNTSDPAVRRRFRELSDARLSALRHVLRSSGVDTLELTTGQPYVPALMSFFKNRERRR